MIKDYIEKKLTEALAEAAGDWNTSLDDLGGAENLLAGLKIERPRNPDHGDYAVNISPLARYAKMPPPKIAETVSTRLQNGNYQTEVIAGFINFKLSDDLLLSSLKDLLHSDAPGKNDRMANDLILLEYVSANPTGPLHIGHGRWAALGDSLVRIFRHSGAVVTPEFYINDAGEQMVKIGTSLWWRSLELLKDEGALPNLKLDFPEDYPQSLPYPGEFVVDMAKEFLADSGRRAKLLSVAETLEEGMDYDFNWLMLYARDTVLEKQKALLKQYGVEFEAWFSEKAYIHDRGLVEETLDLLTERGHTERRDGALWFKSSELGDDKDRVLVKSDGKYTYLAADLAYHHHKYAREDESGKPQYNRIMNIWGADHHGYIARMKAGIQAMGHDVDQFEVLLGQLVNLIVEGEKTRMGKRRKMLTLDDVIAEVGVDAARFWMVSKSADSALDFDVELATSQTNENPVFYAQYAHARCAGILRNATEPAHNVDTGETKPPVFTAEELATFEAAADSDALKPLAASLTDDPVALATLKQLLLKLDGFEEIVADAARHRSPHFIVYYMLDLASEFHTFYGQCRILTDDVELSKVRLMLVRAVQKVLKQALWLLGVSAPEKM